MYDLVVLISRNDVNDGRPVAPHVVDGELDLATVDVDVRLGLQPAGQSAAAGVWQTVDEVAEEETLVRVAAERNDAV